MNYIALKHRKCFGVFPVKDSAPRETEDEMAVPTDRKLLINVFHLSSSVVKLVTYDINDRW